MMTTSEKVAYLKGLADGLVIDTETKEGKLIKAIIDVLEEMAYELSDVQDDLSDLTEQVELIDEDLDTLEEDYYDLVDEDEDECGCGCGCDDEDDGPLYEVTCANCNDTVYLDEDMLDLGSINCPGCGELLEFVLDEDETEE